MTVCLLLILFASLMVLLGGNDTSASIMYYDADFTELYNTGDEEGVEGQQEALMSMDDMVKCSREQNAKSGSAKNAIPTTLPEDFDDPAKAAQEIYDKFNV